MKTTLVWLLGLLLLAGCRTNRPPQAADDGTAETYYHAKADPELNRKRLLPDPVNGLGQTNDASIRLIDVQVTRQFTVLSLTFENRDVRGSDTKIMFEASKAHLTTPDGKRTFKFVRAEGIAIAPDDENVRYGDRVSFKVYFEPLPPDVTEFGMFECEDTEANTCWNIKNIILPPVTPSTSKQP